MLWVALLFIAGTMLEWPAMWRAGEKRELAVHGALSVAALAMAALVHWRLHLRFEPLAPLEALFRPITDWFYRIL
ncbi:MAG: hypothetical protein QJR06_05720 [Alicyclobacillaceae bacterium]|nr:hypothetical protein [Alicyclobacillaceae bacterium]